MSELSDLLKNAKGDASYADIAAKAQRAGHKLSPSAVAKYMRDEQKGRTPDETLQAFAAGLDLDVRVLRQAAGRPGGELGPYVPDERANSLTKGQRHALDRLIVAIVEGGQSWDAGNTSGPEDGDDGPTPTERQLREDAGTTVRPADEPHLTVREPDDLAKRRADPRFKPGENRPRAARKRKSKGEPSEDG